MLIGKEYGWAIVDAKTGKLILFDARNPIYWRRNIATKVAQERGEVTNGQRATVRVCAVEITQFKGSKLPRNRT